MAESKATNITRHGNLVDREQRYQLMGQKGCTVWFTGLSACGKSTIAVALEKKLLENRTVAYVLDGDNIRFGLNKNLGFSAEDRTENIRRIAEVSKLFADAGVIVLASFISPYLKDREAIRKLHEEAGIGFIECYVDTPLEVCEQRDPKGLYKKARAGEIKGFTGIDDRYDPPTNPELVLHAADDSIESCVDQVFATLERDGYRRVD